MSFSSGARKVFYSFEMRDLHSEGHSGQATAGKSFQSKVVQAALLK
jgi:hypothetical protein